MNASKSIPARRAAAVALATMLLLVLTASGALAHVTVRADTVEPGGFAKYTVRVPNESDTAATTGIEVEFPDGFEPGLVRPVEGWTMELADGVLTISGGSIAVGEFQEFEFSARNPEEATTLVFPAIQTYDDGEEAAWVGEADADQPAPSVELVAADDSEGDTASDDGGTDTLTIIALVAGVLGLVLGGIALAASRRKA